VSSGKIKLVKYIFLDVVAYSQRTIEAQCDVIAALNCIVKETLHGRPKSSGPVIYLPTGDGMCIALLGAQSVYDAHVTLAKEMLHAIYEHNRQEQDQSRKFEVRIGINQSDDNIVEDINGRRNVTGSGINNARRIMDLADGSQILVSSTVHDTLYPREKYHSAFAKFRAQAKHGLVLDVYLLVEKNLPWLNVNMPQAFASRPSPEPALPKLAAYYLAHSIKNESFILEKARESDWDNPYYLKVLLWFLAKDSEEESERGSQDIHQYRILPEIGSNAIDVQLKWFRQNVDYQVANPLAEIVLDDAVPRTFLDKYLTWSSGELIVNSEGRNKLKQDWPSIWNEFDLGHVPVAE